MEIERKTAVIVMSRSLHPVTFGNPVGLSLSDDNSCLIYKQDIYMYGFVTKANERERLFYTRFDRNALNIIYSFLRNMQVYNDIII